MTKVVPSAVSIVLRSMLILFAIAVLHTMLSWEEEVWAPSRESLTGRRVASDQVQQIMRPILFAQFLGIVGRPFEGDDAWYGLLLDEADKIAALPLRDRLDVYGILIRHANWEAESIDTFEKMVKSDAQSLGKALDVFRQSFAFHRLSSLEKKKVTGAEAWVKSLAEQGAP